MLLQAKNLDSFLKDCEIASVGVRHLIIKAVQTLLEEGHAGEEESWYNPFTRTPGATPTRPAAALDDDGEEEESTTPSRSLWVCMEILITIM